MAKPTLLVIDDDEGVRDAFSLALGNDDIEVDTASTGLEGIEKAVAQPPDLVILDIRMPGINGIDTMRKLWDLLPHPRIHILTAFHEEFMDDLKAAAKDGCRFELIRKPLDLEQIRAVVQSLIGNETQREPL